LINIYKYYSQKNILIEKTPVYTEEFLEHVVQPEMNLGDVLIYNPRVLHSTMPNNTNITRRALLTHITTRELAEEMKLVDNVYLE
jgi:ectoine hydroxylase-related dioxygenase (phytanoyl-CoA dioxygenase family)